MKDLKTIKESYINFLGVLQYNEDLITASIENSINPLLEAKDFRGAKEFLVNNFNDSPYIKFFVKFSKIIEDLEFNEEFIPGY